MVRIRTLNRLAASDGKMQNLWPNLCFAGVVECCAVLVWEFVVAQEARMARDDGVLS